MMTTWYWILGVLVYFQQTTASLVPDNWLNIAACQGKQCQQYQLAYQQQAYQEQAYQQQAYQQQAYQQQAYQPQALQETSNSKHQVSSYNYHPSIQGVPLTSYYQPAVQREATSCPFGHALTAQQLDNQQKILELKQSRVHQYQAANEQIQEYHSSQRESNNGYLPPSNHLQLGSVDIQQSHISSETQQQSNNEHLQLINQNQHLVNIGYQHNQINEQSQQQLNNNYLQLINQNQHIANVGIQQNQYASSETSQHLGKIKQIVKYDVSHVHQPNYQYHQNQNVYSDAKSSTNIEQHHDIHHHAEGSEESHEIDVLTGKKKKDHDAYYKFQYSVNDKHTGDIKNHKEERSGDEVTGEYSLVEDDGNVRTVKYFADWKTGFHATVHNSKPRS